MLLGAIAGSIAPELALTVWLMTTLLPAFIDAALERDLGRPAVTARVGGSNVLLGAAVLAAPVAIPQVIGLLVGAASLIAVQIFGGAPLAVASRWTERSKAGAAGALP